MLFAGRIRDIGPAEWNVVKNMISAKRAFQIALEDPKTISFIQTVFSRPEEHASITSRKWLSKDNSGFRWNIELMEENLPYFRRLDLVNVVLVEVDPKSEKITKRCYLAHILHSEYKKYIAQSSYHFPV